MNPRAIEKLRDHIYRRSRAQRVKTMRDAARLIDSVGFCLLFASAQGIELPSLFEAIKGKRDVHIEDWDADSERLWVWKNDLPAAHRAYYGKALAGGKPAFIARKFLPHFLALRAPESIEKEYARGRIAHEAKRVHDVLRDKGPTPTIALRAATGLDTKRYHHALDELQRAMVILPMGAMVETGAWTSQVFELVARWFPREWERAQTLDQNAARRALIARYLATVIAATMPMIARVFGWSRADLKLTVEQLIAKRIIVQRADWFELNAR